MIINAAMSLSVQQWMQRGVLFLSLMLLGLLFVVFLLIGSAYLRQNAVREMTMQAAMMQPSLTQTMAENPDALSKALLPLAANSQLQSICLEGQAGQMLSGWVRGQGTIDGEDCRQQFQRLENNWSSAALRYPLTFAPGGASERATLWLMADVPSVFYHFRALVLAMLAAVLFFIAVSFLFIQRMKVILLRPVRQIANTAQRVSLYKDFSLRVTPGPLVVVPREIGALIDSFNAMLREIEDRDGKLLRKTVEIEKARQLAEAANIAKSQFLANISHELRTPLNAILGFSTMIKDQQHGPVTEVKYLEYASDIHDSGQHLLTIINDVLDLSRAEAGKLTIHYEQVALPRIIDKAVNMVAGRAREGGVSITLQVAEKMPRLVADKVRILQILLNLLSNAVKFTDPGGQVTLRAWAEEGVNGVHYFLIEIMDTGVGMTAEEVKAAFHNFAQADSDLNRKYQGAGLGLPLTHKLVELHHGKITIESEKGKGTTVRVRLVSNPALLD
jgi:signal transduction histidine kinase